MKKNNTIYTIIVFRNKRRGNIILYHVVWIIFLSTKIESKLRMLNGHYKEPKLLIYHQLIDDDYYSGDSQ